MNLTSTSVIISEGFQIFFKHLVEFLKSSKKAAIIAVVSYAVYTTIVTIGEINPSIAAGNSTVSSIIIGIILLASYIGLIGSMFLLQINYIRSINAKLDGKQLEKIDTKKLTLSYILVAILSFLAVLGGMLLIVIPGIIFMVWFSFSPMALILEGKKGTAALGHSHDLVRGIFWKVLGRLILIGLVVTVIGGIVSLPEMLFAGLAVALSQINNVASVILTITYGALAGVTSVLIGLFGMAMHLRFYRAVKELKEHSVPMNQPVPTPTPSASL